MPQAQGAGKERRLRHYAVKVQIVRYAQATGAIEVRRVPTEDNVADVFTKPLNRERLDKLKQMMGITKQ